jgi:ATP-dependent Lon protease
LKASYPERLDILQAVSLEERFEKAFPLLQRQIDGLKLVQERQKGSARTTGRPKPKASIHCAVNCNSSFNNVPLL